ncbi:MAG: hypothetical protein JWQ38_2027 [Flavipsychrobacter sp.]|nr:hypothetical protein [Flavipsychrobacter sp.]
MDSTHTDKTKLCPQCGTSFTCSPMDCWCSKLPAIMPMDINASCYCPQCLSKMINEKLEEQDRTTSEP